MSNKELFLKGYLDKIAEKYNVHADIAFEIFSISAVLDLSFQDVYDNVLVKGAKDGGIDGVYFLEQGDYYIMYVFQCKNTLSIKSNNIDKFRNDFNDVFTNGNRVNKPNIEDIIPKLDEYKQLSSAGYIIEPRLFFLFNGIKDDPDRGGNIQAYKAYHNMEQGFEIWDSEDIYEKVSSLIKAQNRRKTINFTFNPEASNVTIGDHQALYSFSIQNIRAVNFRIKAIDLCALIEEEIKENSTYDFLFSDNIRGFLGLRARANQKMSNTIDNPDEAIYFPFLNNGITIICGRLKLPNGPQNRIYNIPTTNPVIVNGLQTSRVLFSKYTENRSKIENIYVNVRLYETDDQELIDKITDATNTQTPINFRDKVSNKDFNAWAKELFELNHIALITKRGETFLNKISKELKETINSDTVLKYWYATYFEKPELAKNSIATVLEQIYDAIITESPLSKLFNGEKDSPVYLQLLRAYRIYKKVQAEKNKQIQYKQFLSYSDELLAYGIYKFFGDELSQIEIDEKLDNAFNHAYKTIDIIVQNDIRLHEQSGKTFSYTSYFKRPKCRIDYNNELKIIESENLVEELLLK